MRTKLIPAVLAVILGLALASCKQPEPDNDTPFSVPYGPGHIELL